MKIGIPKERRDEERRAAASPETVKRYKGMGLEPVVEAGAGIGAAVADQAYQDAGASIGDEAGAWGSEIVLKVQRPTDAEMGQLRQGQVLIGMLDPYNAKDQVEAYAKAGVSAFAMELLPRTTRAQAMDVLSSQANLAGYKALIDAMAEYSRVLPMMMTAAGTVTASQGVHRRRRRGGATGDRDRAAHGGGGDRDRRAPGRARGDREPGREVRGLRAGGCRDQGRLRPAADARGAGRAGQDGGRAPQDPGHRGDHGADPGAEGAADRHRRDGARR